MRWAAGRPVLRRYWRAGRISLINVMTVVSDDDRGVRLWQPAGVPYWRLMTADGRTHHAGTVDSLGPMTLEPREWTGSGVMPFQPAGGEPWSVWWFFGGDRGTFEGWYVNLEDPWRRWDDGAVAGVDTADHALDITVAPDRSWEWKDEDEFADKTGERGYWSTAEAAEIRAAGERVVKLIEAATFPFDGTWCDIRPTDLPAADGFPTRPDGWDRPRA
jgi:hypothetical protein